MNQRYARQMILPEVGQAGQAKMASTSVLVVGAGGLGCPILLYLAGAGIGQIIIVDHDQVALSNLHRQVLYDMDDLGQPKAKAAAAKLLKFNPECRVASVATRLTPANADSFVAKSDIIVDAADSLAVTYMLSDAAMAVGKPLVSASVIGLKGYVGAFCGDVPSYRAVFPDMPQQIGNCATLGVLGSAVGILGSFQTQIVLQLILGSQPSPAGKIVTLDFQTLVFGGFSFLNALEPHDGFSFIDVTQFSDDDFIIDLRGVDEAPVTVTPQASLLDVDVIGHLEKTKDRRVVLCCCSGMRAWRAARKLQARGFDNLALVALGA